MDYTHTVLYVVFPYIALSIFVVGHTYRYFTDRFHWNAHSSELLGKTNLKVPITLFHWGIILTFLGHFTGLLTPQWFLDRIGINAKMHDLVAIITGAIFGLTALIGIIWLFVRRIMNRRVARITTLSDIILLVLLIFVIGVGTYNAFFARYDILNSVAPWIRGIVTFTPDASLMAPVPWSYKIHVLAAFLLFAISPFTRLVHIWSVPIPYLARRLIVFRKRTFGTA